MWVFRKLRVASIKSVLWCHAGLECRGVRGLNPQFMSTCAHFWVKIGHKLQSLGKISNISAADSPVLLGQFQHWCHVIVTDSIQTAFSAWPIVLFRIKLKIVFASYSSKAQNMTCTIWLLGYKYFVHEQSVCRMVSRMLTPEHAHKFLKNFSNDTDVTKQKIYFTTRYSGWHRVSTTSILSQNNKAYAMERTNRSKLSFYYTT